MSSQPIQWKSYEAKAASIANERRVEDLQLEQLRLRLQKMRELNPEQSLPSSAA